MEILNFSNLYIVRAHDEFMRINIDFPELLDYGHKHKRQYFIMRFKPGYLMFDSRYYPTKKKKVNFVFMYNIRVAENPMETIHYQYRKLSTIIHHSFVKANFQNLSTVGASKFDTQKFN